MKRNNFWLKSRFENIWSRYFSDVPKTNNVTIKFGRYAKLRLGSIKLDGKNKNSIITITGMFKEGKIPLNVVDCTIAHELTHYSHGFSSPHPRMHKYPHEGGVVKREMQSRGMGRLLMAYKEWIKEYRRQLRYGR